jgi:DNA-binding response OmpR family regulator
MTTEGPKILLIEDEQEIRRFLRVSLGGQGYRLVESATGRDGVMQAASQQPDLMILDLGLPDIDGMEVIRQVREWSHMPIIILSARGQEHQKVEALDAGADDYLTKPFSPRTLLARVRAVLRRAGLETGGAMSAGSLRLDLESHALHVGDAAPVKLTKLETRLLQILIANAGHVVGTERLLTHVWGHRGSGDRQLLKQLVHRLRHKIEDDPAAPTVLKTEAGAGYRLEERG